MMFDSHPDSPAMPPLPVRLSLTRLFLELSLYMNALEILTGVLATNDEEVEGWYLEGWCFFLMAEQARESMVNVGQLTWEEIARDARNCLEICQNVSIFSGFQTDTPLTSFATKLHKAQKHPDEQILQHTQEIIAELATAWVELSSEEVMDEADGDDDSWVDDEGDVEME